MEIGVRKFIKEVNSLTRNGSGPVWEITEELKERREYTLRGLEFEQEQGILIASDTNDDIYKGYKALTGMLVKSINKIEQLDKTSFTIYLPNGIISIKAKKNNIN